MGSTVAGYRLILLVGLGATGAVYLAEREGVPERVALKVLDGPRRVLTALTAFVAPFRDGQAAAQDPRPSAAAASGR